MSPNVTTEARPDVIAIVAVTMQTGKREGVDSPVRHDIDPTDQWRDSRAAGESRIDCRLGGSKQA